MLMKAPDPPGNLSFIVTTPSSVLVSWTVPSPRSNGIVLVYELSYYQDFHVDGMTADMFQRLVLVFLHFCTKPLVGGLQNYR